MSDKIISPEDMSKIEDLLYRQQVGKTILAGQNYLANLEVLKSTTSRGSCEISAYLSWKANLDVTQQQIEYYVDKYEPYDKAGAYAIQEWIGVTGIKSIQGDFYNVMGLPVSRVLQLLKEL